MRELRLAYTTGATLTAKVINAATGSVVDTVSLSESTGYYVGDFPTASAGTYDVIYLDGLDPIGSDTLAWDGTGIASPTLDLSPITSSLSAIRAKTDTLGAASVVVASPVITADSIALIRGDDYKAVDGRAITFTLSNAPSLAGATVRLKALSLSDGAVGLNVAGTVNGDVVAFDLAATSTSSLQPGIPAYAYDVEATLSNADVITLVQGTMTVVSDVR